MKITILIFLIIILLIILILFKNYKKESFSNFSNIKCPKTIKNLSNFCIWDKDDERCKCVFQKSNDYYYNFPVCCNSECSKLSKSECVPNDNVKYYCQNNSGTDCDSYNAYINEKRVSGNVCGTEILTNNYKRPYMSYEECKKDINQCTKYKNKNDCTSNNICGWCSNSSGKGICIEGTSSGPIDLFKYHYCDPNQKNENNSWSYGKQIKL